MEAFSRSELLFGKEGMRRLQQAHVAVVGIGGVGCALTEALARGGVGKMTIVDHDTVAPSNLNRQLVALESTIGLPKTQVMYHRLKDAAPDLDLTAIDAFYLPDSPVPIPEDATVVVDAIDTVSAKLHLARVCRERGVPLISCMGMGNRLDPAQIRVGDIFETSGCPLCRVMRQGLRKLGVPSLRCVYSLEPARHPQGGEGAEQKGGHPAPGSVSFVPSVAGIYLAAETIRLIAGEG